MPEHKKSVARSEAEVHEVTLRLCGHEDPSLEDVENVLKDIRSRPPTEPDERMAEAARRCGDWADSLFSKLVEDAPHV